MIWFVPEASEFHCLTLRNHWCHFNRDLWRPLAQKREKKNFAVLFLSKGNTVYPSALLVFANYQIIALVRTVQSRTGNINIVFFWAFCSGRTKEKTRCDTSIVHQKSDVFLPLGQTSTKMICFSADNSNCWWDNGGFPIFFWFSKKNKTPEGGCYNAPESDLKKICCVERELRSFPNHWGTHSPAANCNCVFVLGYTWKHPTPAMTCWVCVCVHSVCSLAACWAI